MSDYIAKILARADLQVIRSLLIDGVGDADSIDRRQYMQRIKEDSDAMCRMLETEYSDDKRRDAVSDDIFSAITAYQEVYFELGMKCGARVLHQLLEG